MSETPADTVLATLDGLAREKLGDIGELRRESRLIEDLALDSIRLLTLAMAVEDHFRIRLDERDEAGLATIGDLVDVIVAKTADSEGAADDG